MAEITLTVTLNVDGDAVEMETLFGEYLTSPEAPFATDYGPEAGGGWDGPTIVSVSVSGPTKQFSGVFR